MAKKTALLFRHTNGIGSYMFIASTYTSGSFDYLLIGMLAFNALIVCLLAFVPGLHARVTDWILGRERAQ